MPELRKEVTIADQVKFEKYFPFDTVRTGGMHRSLDWNNDPTFDDLLKAGPVGLGLAPTSAKDFEKAVIVSSYGGLIYTRFRCAWVHEFLPDQNGVVMHGLFHADDDPPYYHYIQNTKRWMLVITPGFLFQTFEAAIDSFQTYADQNNKSLPK